MGEGVTPGGHVGILRQRRAEAQGPSQHHILGEKEGRYKETGERWPLLVHRT
jgi:hypothetical protein